MSDKILVWADGRYHAMPAELWEEDKVSEKIEFEGKVISVKGSLDGSRYNLTLCVLDGGEQLDGREWGESYKVTLEPKEPELKPCPFCGGKAMWFNEDIDTARIWPRYRIQCKHCDAHTISDPNRDFIAGRWNRREGE